MNSEIADLVSEFPSAWLAEQRDLVQRAVKRGWIRSSEPDKAAAAMPPARTKKRATVKRRAK